MRVIPQIEYFYSLEMALHLGEITDAKLARTIALPNWYFPENTLAEFNSLLHALRDEENQ